MPISYCDQVVFRCSACDQRFGAEVWTLVDAVERTDLADALCAGTLNVVTCPHCAYSRSSGTAMLFHDPLNRRVYFAAPADVEEHTLREQAQALLYLLLSQLPEEEHRSYLGDVQVEQELEGVRRAIARRRRQRSRVSGATHEQVVAQVAEGPRRDEPSSRLVAQVVPSDSPPIYAAIEALLGADSVEGFAAIVDAYEVLLSTDADAVFAHLIETAYQQGDRDLAAALREAHMTLVERRAGLSAVANQPDVQAVPVADMAALAGRPVLSETAYLALLHVDSIDALVGVLGDYPVLLESWVDGVLTVYVEGALDDGNERLARDIEERREALAALRCDMAGPSLLHQACHELLQTSDEPGLAHVLTQYPILLTDIAQEALFAFAGDAHVQGDHALAERILACRAMLRQVREGLQTD